MSDPSLFSELVSRKILTVEENHLQILNKVDISSYGSRAWAFSLQELGQKGGRKFLYELGYAMGTDAAEEILEVVKQMQAYVTSKLRKLSNLIEITGFGIVDIKFSKDGSIKVIVRKNHIIGFSKELYGKKSLACEFYRGVYSAFINVYKKTNIKLKKEACICKGDKNCILTT